MCLYLQELAVLRRRVLGKMMSRPNFPVHAFHRLSNAVERMETGTQEANNGMHSVFGITHLSGISVAKLKI